MNEKDLLKLKEKIDKAKHEAAELKGQQKYLMAELKKTWKCASIKEAEGELKKLEEEITQVNQDISTAIQQLEQEYNV